MKFKITLLALFSSTLMAVTALEVVKKAHMTSYYQGDDGSSQMLMKVYPKGSKKPIKKLFYMLKKDVEEGGKQLFFTYFVKPTDIQKTTFLVKKFIDKDDFRRLYIPASDKVLPISGSRKQDPFMGSDFTYEDISGRHFSKDNHKLLREEKFNNKECFVTESIPKVKESKIAKMVAWIDKSNFIPLKVQFYNHEGKIYKEYTASNVKLIQNFPTIMKRTMTSLLDETKTEMLVNPKKVKYNLGIDESVFTERSLKKPPMKYFK